MYVDDEPILDNMLRNNLPLLFLSQNLPLVHSQNG